MAYFLYGIVPIGLQIYFGVHAYRRGRYGWMWVIFFFSLIGCAVYFFAEYLPDLQAGGTAGKIGSRVAGIVDPNRELRELEEQLQISDTFGNRQALAEGYLNAGRFTDAAGQFQRCLKGPYADDPDILEKLAYCQFRQGNHPQSLETLEQIKTIQGELRSQEAQLLWAVNYESMGKTEEALAAYAAILPKSSGQEVRCRYAMLLKKAGQTEKADQLFNEIITHTKLSPKFYQIAQAKWVEMAKKSLSRKEAS